MPTCLVISDIVNQIGGSSGGNKFEKEIDIFKKYVYSLIQDVVLGSDISVVYIQYEYNAAHLTGRSGRRLGRVNRKAKTVSAYIEVTIQGFDSNENPQHLLMSYLVEILTQLCQRPDIENNGVRLLIERLCGGQRPSTSA